MSVKYRYHTILVVDIEGFGRRRNPVQSWLRERLRQVLEDAFEAAGIDVLAGPPPVDRGDGMFWLLPATVPKEDVTGPFVDRLARGLREHAGTSSANGALRLRLALHGGEVGADGQGWVGADLNTACRMVDHQPLRDALADVPGAGLVVAVSDEWHRKVVSHHHPGIDATEYRPVRFDAKEIRNETVWVRVPGHAWSPRAGATTGAAPAEEPGGRPTSDGRAADAPPPRITHNSGIGQLVGDIRDGGIGVAHGGVRQDFGPRAADRPADDDAVLRELKALRVQLQAALERREIDADTYEDATGELDTAEACAGAQDERSHGRLVRALLKLGALVEGIGVIAEPVRGLVNTLRGGE
ncbi:hypothetical protein RM844_28275 [Streptomyces sp. DSM 44915]|uniref:Guanylate cyclase domain-containing protein n=1 Tax=Streptomyces chisholmiae TaxID=3075540 RepID=A0ABU2JZK0_9ACTN|nr:hypothetical protein [Streptomyces sp. DSM 44915]MDT0270174.1 hypothetical protein [Streptomyces sp. DSM 44915]